MINGETVAVPTQNTRWIAFSAWRGFEKKVKVTGHCGQGHQIGVQKGVKLLKVGILKVSFLSTASYAHYFRKAEGSIRSPYKYEG